MALELSRRAEKCEMYRGRLQDATKSLEKIEAEKAALIKQVSVLRSQLSHQKRQGEEKVQSLTRELQEVEHKGLLAGMSGCREQIMLTPVGQQFLHVLKERLIKELCRTPHLLDTLGDAITALLEVGRKFAMAKLSAEDLNPGEDLKELVMQAPNLTKIMGIDEGISWESPWWMEGFQRAFEVFVRGSFSDPTYPSWGVLPFPLAFCPNEMLPFDDLDRRMGEANPNSSPERTPDQMLLPVGGDLSLVDPRQDEEMGGCPESSSPVPEISRGNEGGQGNPDVASPVQVDQTSSLTL